MVEELDCPIPTHVALMTTFEIDGAVVYHIMSCKAGDAASHTWKIHKQQNLPLMVGGKNLIMLHIKLL